jgi:site-specific recombinase XerD
MNPSDESPASPDKLFEMFLKEKQFLEGVSPATIYIYSKAWLAFERHKAVITKSGVKAFMVSMISSGVKPGTANSYARGINSFLTWLFENDYTEAHLKVPLTKEPKRVLHTYTPEEVEKIINHKPKSRTGKRMMALLFLLIDTGARINEALSLTRKDIDWDNLLVTLLGKGDEERKVPISLECRKHLFRWLNTHDHQFVFCTREGTRLRYDNLRRDFLVILRAVGVEKSEGSFHAFRRYFGKQYIRNGGDSLYLQRVFGHSTLEMTRKYVEADDEDLSRAHKSLSPLERLKRK